MTDGRRSVLVTDAREAHVVAVIRSLDRAGWRVAAADHVPGAPGFVSRHASSRHLVPWAADDPDAAAEGLAEIVRSESIDVVLPTTDNSIIAVSAHRDRFEPTVLAMPDHDAFEWARDKRRTLALAEELAIPIPPTLRVEDADAAVAATADLGWPVVVKPISSHRETATGPIATLGVTYANDEAELRNTLDDLGPVAYPVLLQRYEPGTGVGVELLTHEGRPVAAFQHRRLRELPISGGMSSLRVSEPVDADLLDHSIRLLEAMNWTGLAMVEFRVGPNGPRLMEINGRVWGSMALPVLAGMDFPSRLVDMHLNGPPPVGAIDTDYRVGVECRNLGLELRWVASATRQLTNPSSVGPNPRPREIARTMIGMVDPRNDFDVQRLDDIRPGLSDAWIAVKQLGRDAIERVGHRSRSGDR